MKLARLTLFVLAIGVAGLCPLASMASTCTTPTVTMVRPSLPQASTDRFVESHRRYGQPSAAARVQMVDALTPEHREAFASAIGDLATSPAPDAAAAMQRFDAVLGPSERQAIFAAQDRYDVRVSGDPSYPRPPASAAVLLLGATLYGPGGVLLFSDSYLLHSSGFTTSAQSASGGCLPSPSATDVSGSQETRAEAAAHLGVLREKLRSVEREERRQMLAALSRAHRQRFGAIVGAFAVAQTYDTAAAGRQTGAMLSGAERSTILRVADSASPEVDELQYAETQEMAAATGPQRIQVQLPNDPAAAMLSVTLAVSFSLHNGPRAH